ncbi:MAG: hybrid sensory kinase, partial [Cyanobacteria bacterium RYN_339]|nr:hybrid sensory kinase [Cyanobacteria bacterium RYN_339]
IVDDVLQNLGLLRIYLTHHGFDVRCTTNGPEALELARTELPALILLDVMMEGMDGLEVCRRLKQQAETRPIPVMLVSAHASKQDIASGLAAGAVDYVPKPFSFVEVKNRIDNVLAGVAR